MKLKLLAVGLTATIFASQSGAVVLVYEGILSGLNESPPNASPGTGIARATLDTVAGTMRIEASFSGLTGTVTASHIHVRPDSLTPNGGVATQLPTFSGFPSGVTAGTYDNTFNMLLSTSWNASYITANGGTPTSAWNAFQAKMAAGLTYLNVHSTTFGSGELRANLALVPEPATLSILSLGIIAALRKRQK